MTGQQSGGRRIVTSFLAVSAKLWERAATNMRDVAAFGPRFLLRHLPRVTGAYTTAVHVRGAGRVHIRAGQSDVEVIRQIFLQNEYELDEAIRGRVAARYAEIIRTGRSPVIVDAGANIGAASIWFQMRYPGAAVVAVEPDPENLGVLRRNVEGRQGIIVVPAAVGSRDGAVRIERHGLGWSTRTKRADSLMDGTGVSVITMADAFASVKDGTPFLAKIDIEGFESDLFAENTDWLSEVYVVAIEPHDWLLPGQRSSRTFQAAMSRFEFEIFVSGKNLIYVRA
jgi:FkbM family methyltransferase